MNFQTRRVIRAALGLASLVIAIGVVGSIYVRPVTRSELSWKSSGPARTRFVEKAVEDCIEKQRSLPDDRRLPEVVLKDFCGCYANSWADVATNKDMKYWHKHGNPSPEAISKIEASYEKCRQELLNKV